MDTCVYVLAKLLCVSLAAFSLHVPCTIPAVAYSSKIISFFYYFWLINWFTQQLRLSPFLCNFAWKRIERIFQLNKRLYNILICQGAVCISTVLFLLAVWFLFLVFERKLNAKRCQLLSITSILPSHVTFLIQSNLSLFYFQRWFSFSSDHVFSSSPLPHDKRERIKKMASFMVQFTLRLEPYLRFVQNGKEQYLCGSCTCNRNTSRHRSSNEIINPPIKINLNKKPSAWTDPPFRWLKGIAN